MESIYVCLYDNIELLYSTSTEDSISLSFFYSVRYYNIIDIYIDFIDGNFLYNYSSWNEVQMKITKKRSLRTQQYGYSILSFNLI